MSVDEKLLNEAKKLLLEDRLMHKNWNVRNDTNIDLASLYDSITDPKDSRLREFSRNLLGYDPNTRHCLYVLDADLIMLAADCEGKAKRKAGEFDEKGDADVVARKPYQVALGNKLPLIQDSLKTLTAVADVKKSIKTVLGSDVFPATQQMLIQASGLWLFVHSISCARIRKLTQEIVDLYVEKLIQKLDKKIMRW